MIKQDRRTMNLPTPVYEGLSYLQAEVRLILKEQGVDYVLSKTAMTNVVETLVRNADPKQLAKLLK